MIIHREDLIIEPCSGDITRAVRAGDDVEMNRYEDRAIRVDSGAFTRNTAAARRATAGCAMASYLIVDRFYFEVIDMARLALSAGIYEGLVRLKNDAVGSYNFAVLSARRVVTLNAPGRRHLLRERSPAGTPG